MKRLIGCVAVALLWTPLAIQRTNAQAADPRIAEAIRPLPDDLQAGATVVVYDQKTGERQVLRQGTNMMECQPKSPVDGFTRCYHKQLAPRRDLEAKLRAQGKKDEEVTAAVQEATKAGTIKAPTFGMMSYRLSDDKGRIQKLWVMSVPNATPETIGVSTSSQREEALMGKGLPWLMLPGTPGAHVMIPINK
jgi:hypothetical protein